jgi:putative protease
MHLMEKPELLAPAGDLERGIIALDFGADAIYLGGQAFSLRANASNFNLNTIKKISEYCKKNNKKWFLVINVLCQNPMMKDFLPYLKKVIKFKPNAYIASDPFIITQIRKIDKKTQIHISTQQSVTNSKAALF